MPLLRGTDGQTYQTQNELASGGEGRIVALQGRRDVVAKLYHPGQDITAREGKLRVMVADPPRDEMRERFGHAAIAWPLALLSEGGRFVGFVMPRIDAARPLINAYNPRARGALSFDWRDQHQVALNLCTAVNALHVKGYVVGDLNPRNILVTAQGLVTLVDTDSFQVRANGVVHRCPVGTPEYTPRGSCKGNPSTGSTVARSTTGSGSPCWSFSCSWPGFTPSPGPSRTCGTRSPARLTSGAFNTASSPGATTRACAGPRPPGPWRIWTRTCATSFCAVSSAATRRPISALGVCRTWGTKPG